MTDPAPPPPSSPAPAASSEAFSEAIDAPVVSRRQGAPPASRALVLMDPRGAFASVRARPLTAALFAVMVVLSVAPPVAFIATNDVLAVVKREMKKSGRMDTLTPEQKEAFEATGASGLKVALPLGAAAKRALWMTVVAGLCFALLRGTRPQLRFSPVLAAVCLSTAPLALQDVLAALTYAFKDTSSLDLQNVVLSNPAAWLKMETGHRPLAVLLRGVDFFDLWACALTGLGVAVIAEARTRMGYAVAFGLHAALVGIGAIIAAAAG